MSRFFVIEVGNGRLVVVERPPRNAVIAKRFDDEYTAKRWARDEQVTRDALRTANGRRRYYSDLFLGGLVLFLLGAFCITAGLLGWTLSSLGS